MKGDRLRIEVAEAETCWADDLGNGTVRIQNVPFDGRWNLHDVVKVKRNKDGLVGFMAPVTLVKRIFRYRTVLEYAEASDYAKLVKAFGACGWAIEGVYGPGETRADPSRGLAVLAHSGPGTLDMVRAQVKECASTVAGVVLARVDVKDLGP